MQARKSRVSTKNKKKKNKKVVGKRSRCGGSGLINTLINKLPIELHIPGYQYCGPGTKLAKRLARGDKGINPLDAHCKTHDISYNNSGDLNTRHRADQVLQHNAWERFKAKDASAAEKTAALAVATAMKTKRMLGMGLNNNNKTVKNKTTTKKKIPLSSIRKIVRDKIQNDRYKTKNVNSSSSSNGGGIIITPTLIKTALNAAKAAVRHFGGKRNITLPRIIPIPKTGGFLPFLLPLFAGLSATGALAGGISGIARAVNSARDARIKSEEEARHNRTMEAIALGKKGSGLYLRPYRKSGAALYLKPYEKRLGSLPERPLTDVDLRRYAKNIPYFRGVFMRDNLPKGGPHENECGIVNLDSTRGPGTHWVCYRKHGSTVWYYNSFGNLRPPCELIDYFRGNCNNTTATTTTTTTTTTPTIYYNYEREQKFNTTICGHLCLKFLCK
ncbi:hypothetical protein RN001_001890 [Aquatica leii]|uniref:Phospholipase A2-like domain-containing protein n=1 Tax=Aquatica leii TaxID=1421715 RepID=A0AAN7Q4N9_9COLE|nr:hypothetical protein RN001_001890 [Aquatica leii]